MEKALVEERVGLVQIRIRPGIMSARSGMKNAAAKGAKIGRPEVTKDNLPDKFWKYYYLYKKGDMSITDFAKVMDISRTTIYKYISIAEMD